MPQLAADSPLYQYQVATNPFGLSPPWGELLQPLPNPGIGAAARGAVGNVVSGASSSLAANAAHAVGADLWSGLWTGGLRSPGTLLLLGAAGLVLVLAGVLGMAVGGTEVVLNSPAGKAAAKAAEASAA